MGSFGDKKRKESYIERYENIDEQNEGFRKFHYGSHFSNPGIVLQFLVRLQPFTRGALELQSGKFDIADRLFSNMEESFRCALTELADVRELIPEFFSLPEMFLNLNKLDLGVAQSGQRVNNVALPA